MIIRRVVLDTNIVLSALIFQSGRIAKFRDLWTTGRINPLVSRATIEELIRTLSYPKFQLSESEKQELIGDYLPYCEVVQIPNPKPQTPPCQDPADIPFLHLTLAGDADALISGDKHLLALREKVSFSIITAGDFLKAFSE